MRLGRRWWIAAPLVLVAVITVVGGWLNTTDARGRLIDDLTDKPVPSARVALGNRLVTTGASGEYELTTVPKTSKVQVDVPGYLRTQVPTTQSGDVRLTSLSVTIYAYDSTKTPDDRVPSPEARDVDNTKLIAAGNTAGQIVIAPHPGRNAQVLLCAAGFSPTRVTVEGVLMQVPMEPGPPCAPLPKPSPSPTPSPSAGASPSGSPAPSPSPSP